MSQIFNIVLFAVYISISCAQNVPVVVTPLGKISGHYLTSYQNNQYEAYEGVPYALSPTGERRFEPPVPISPWSNELVADKPGNICLQHKRHPNDVGDYVSGDENCLFLNIYTPIRKNNETYPVIFWIHGGGYQYGAGSRFGGKYLIDYNVILVTINYRLGVLGFLSTQDNVVSGNMGLKDQSVALHWVKDNIDSFGGDTSRITLFGLSAGGASVHFHYLSPMSVGLFHSGVSFSGTAFDSWTIVEKSREKAIKMAEIVNCTTNDMQDMINCLKNKPAKVLVTAEAQFMPWHLSPFTPFGPVIEKSADKPFIDREPIDIINSGDVQDKPWITGVVSEEGLYPVAEFALKNDVLKDLNDNWESIAPLILDFNDTIPVNQFSNVSRVIREHYLGNKTINRENLMNLTHMVGDRLFFADAVNAAIAQAKVNTNPVWFYYYTYRASQSVSDDMSDSKENLGVCHGDDVNYVLQTVHVVPTTTESDLAIHKDLVKFWVTVARKGVPKFGPKWLAVNPSKPYVDYLQIAGPGDFRPKSDANLGDRNFWNSIGFDENRELSNPYIVHGSEKSSSDIPAMRYVTFIIACTSILYYANVPSL